MTRTQDLGALKKSGQTVSFPARLTEQERMQRLDAVAKELAKMGKTFLNTPTGIEDGSIEELRATTIENDNSVLSHVWQILENMGIPTPKNIGGILDNLDLTRNTLHTIMCSCEKGPYIAADEAAIAFETAGRHDMTWSSTNKTPT